MVCIGCIYIYRYRYMPVCVCMCVCGEADLHSVAQPEQQTSGRGQMDEDQTSFSLFLALSCITYSLSSFELQHIVGCYTITGMLVRTHSTNQIIVTKHFSFVSPHNVVQNISWSIQLPANCHRKKMMATNTITINQILLWHSPSGSKG